MGGWRVSEDSSASRSLVCVVCAFEKKEKRGEGEETKRVRLASSPNCTVCKEKEPGNKGELQV